MFSPADVRYAHTAHKTKKTAPPQTEQIRRALFSDMCSRRISDRMRPPSRNVIGRRFTAPSAIFASAARINRSPPVAENSIARGDRNINERSGGGCRDIVFIRQRSRQPALYPRPSGRQKKRERSVAQSQQNGGVPGFMQKRRHKHKRQRLTEP